MLMSRLITPEDEVFLVGRLLKSAGVFASHIIDKGRPLTSSESKIAQQVGVLQPGRVRVMEAEFRDVPLDAVTRGFATRLGLSLSTASGMCLGYSIYVRANCMSTSLLAHELRHVAQFERLGLGLEGFLRLYIKEVSKYGYANAPLENDARKFEILMSLR